MTLLHYHRITTNGDGGVDKGTATSPELAKEKKGKRIKEEAFEQPNKIKE